MTYIPGSKGQKTMANSESVAIASDQSNIPVTDSTGNALVGATNETAPSTDIASSGLNGRLQRIAQRLTSLIGLFPTSLGQKIMTGSLSVTIASDQSALSVNDSSLITATNNQNTLIGAVIETAPVSDTASSGLNGRLQRIAQNLSSLLANLGSVGDTTAGSDTAASTINAKLSRVAQNISSSNSLLGATNETAPSTDIASSGLNGRLQRIAQRLTSLIAVFPNALGQNTMANSFPVVIASNQAAIPVTINGGGNTDTLLGSLTETAPATDTASSGLNGRLQRVAQRLTSLIGLLPTALGQNTMANSLAVTIASNQSTLAVVDSAGNTLLGATTETAPTTDTASSGLNGRLQRIAQRLSSLIALLPTSLGQKAMSGSLAVTIASDQSTVNTVDSAAGTLLNTLVTNLGAPGDTPAVSNSQAANINQKLSKISGNIGETNITYLGPINDVVPSNDTDPATINARLQRVCQRLTSLIDLFPTSLGQKTMAASLAVTIASNQSAVPVTVADGSDAAMGAKADSVATTATGNFSLIALTKWIASKMAMQVDNDNAVATITKVLMSGGIAKDVTSLPTYTAGDAVMAGYELNSGALLVNQGDLNPRYDGVSISGSIKKLTFEITRPADTNTYAIGDMIGSGTYNINNITPSLTTAESSGYLVGAKLLSTDTGIVGKRLSLNIFDAGSGSYVSTDNQGFGGGYTINKDRIIRVDFDTISNVLGTVAGVESNVNNIGYPYKLTTGTKFNLILLTKDIFTPSANSTTFYLELYIDYNP